MATDLYGLEASGLPPEMIARLQGITRQQAIAEAMMKQSMQSPEAGAVKGRFQGVTSPLEHVGKLVQAVLANRDMGAARDANAGLAKEATQGRQAAVEAVMQKFRGSPEVGYNDTVGDQPPQGPITEGVKADPRGALMDARMNPFLANAKWVDSMESNLNRTEARDDTQKFQAEQAREARAARAADRASQLEMKKFEIEQRLADRSLDRESRAALQSQSLAIQREIGMARAEATKLAAESRMDAKNEKATEKQAAKDKATKNVSDQLEEVKGYFDELKELGAAVDSSKGALSNAIASARASAPGQFVEGAIATKAQDVRNKIKQAAPMLLNAIRQATAQGARGLDSNVELKFYLQAVTDEKRSVQYNLAAMGVLDRAYGLGMGIKGVSKADEDAVRADFKAASGAAPVASGAPAGGKVVDWNELP